MMIAYNAAAMSLIGTLDEFPLADVLRLFATSRKTGLLTVAGPGREALVRFDKGTVVHALSGRLQGEVAIVDLFGWADGQLSFVPDEKVTDANVAKTLEDLIEEGVRDGKHRHRVHSFFTSDRLVFQWAEPGETGEYLMGRSEWRVLRALDGERELREVVTACGLPLEEVQQLLFQLAEAGFVEKLELHKSLRVQAAGRGGAEGAEMDARIEDEWRKSLRFADGVLNVEVRAGRDRRTTLGVTFRPALVRNLVLPRGILGLLQVKEGDEVSVRPVR
jgi:hypothetical protein